MKTRSPLLQAKRKRWWKIAGACLAGSISTAGYAHVAAPTDAEVGFGVGLPQQVSLTDAWAGIEYQVAVQADRDVSGKLVVANLVVTRPGTQRNLGAKPRLHGLQSDDFAALDLAKGPESSAFWDRRISITKDDVLLVRVEDAQVRPVPGIPSGQVGSVEITSLRLHVFLDSPTQPIPAPKAFASEQYGLTFQTPRDGSYCALPADWSGSDHGTVIFLAPPKKCFGAGYPSSGRGFDGNVPRIEVFYAYDVADDDEASKPPPCKTIGRVRFLGEVRRLCEKSSRQGVQVSVSAKYSADQPAETTLTLLTSHAHLADHLSKFKKLLESTTTCSATWHDDKGGKPFTTGSGPACPTSARWF
jgi:hypothetical protein